MRRSLSILLTLAIWSSSSGLLHLLHDHHAHGSVPHDESNCEFCVAYHAPLTHSAPPAPSIELLTEHGITPVIDSSIEPQRAPLILSCRGPPTV